MGEVVFDSNNDLYAVTGDLTIGPNVVIRGGTGDIGDATLGVVNQGTIRAETGTISLLGPDWRNEGTLEAVGGGTLSLVGTGSTSGSVLIGAGSQLVSAGDYVQTAGSTTLADGTLSPGHPRSRER